MRVGVVRNVDRVFADRTFLGTSAVFIKDAIISGLVRARVSPAEAGLTNAVPTNEAAVTLTRARVVIRRDMLTPRCGVNRRE